MKLKALSQLRSTTLDVGAPKNAPASRPSIDSPHQRANSEHLPSSRAPARGAASQRPRGGAQSLSAKLATLSPLRRRATPVQEDRAGPSISAVAPSLPDFQFDTFEVDFGRAGAPSPGAGDAPASEPFGKGSPALAARRMNSSASTLVDPESTDANLSRASTIVAPAQVQRTKTNASSSKTDVRQVRAKPLDEARVMSRLGRRDAPAGRQLLNDIRDIAAGVRERVKVPDLSEFEARAKLDGSAGLERALSCVRSYEKDRDGELRGLESFAHTRLNVALKSRPKWKDILFRGDRELLETLKEARAVVHNRGRIDLHAAGRPQGELLVSRGKALESSLVLGFKAEPEAIDDPKHPLWSLAGTLGVSLDPVRLRARIT